MADGRTVLRDGEVELELYTRREGMLSAVGHDLRLAARRSTWTYDRDAHTIEGRVDASSIVVLCAREGDHDAPASLSDGDKKKIEASMRDDVLKVSKHPEVLVRATFRPEGDHAKVTGTLSITGVEKPFEADARREGGRWKASCVVDQSRFGIKQYTALMGTLKVARDVRVEFSVAEGRVAGG